VTKPDVMAVAAQHARALVEVPGVVGVVVGGSHARGTADESSDLDLGIYYREPLDVEALRDLASALTGRPTDVAKPGWWGPWVNGGAWLDVEDTLDWPGGRVDWILRDLERVDSEVSRALRGEFSLHHQAGHPFGFLSTIYVGEAAVARVVADPHGELARLQARTTPYPDALRRALVRWLWEAEFSIEIARKPVKRGDAAYVSMCLAHAVGIMAHALHARDGRWVLNEKGLIDAATHLPSAPADFAHRAHAVCGGAGLDGLPYLEGRVRLAGELLADVRSATAAVSES
jgi:predicted nucleotidyltransferase